MPRNRLPIVLLVGAVLVAQSVIAAAANSAPTALAAIPVEFHLLGSRAKQQLLITGRFESPGEADLTREATYESQNPQIASVTAAGTVLPRGEGETQIVARFGGLEARVTVRVAGLAAKDPVDFRTDAIAALSRAGCSQGACHGSPQGKNGFRMSLRGFEPNVDLFTLTREDAGRRTNVLAPANSLILLKGSNRVPHQGGTRFRPADEAYRTLQTWIAEGCQDSATPRVLTRLEVLPGNRRMHSDSPQQQLAARAHFADGSIRDLSGLAVFTTGSDSAAEVSADGLVTFTGTGEATVLVRYLDQIRSVRLTYVRHDPNYAFHGPEAANYVDQHIFAKQRDLQLEPAPPAADDVFLRRVYLDLIGTLPTPDEARTFLDSTAADKRAKLIEQLLQRDEYASFWALKWADVMRGNRDTISERGVHSFHRYLIRNFAEDRPLDQFARDVLTGLGNTLHKPAANFYRISQTPEDAAESMAQLFLGVRIQCAKCHNHPFEALTQNDYYGLAAYFARVKTKGKQFMLDDETVYLARQGEVQHPLTRKNLEPSAFGQPAGPLLPDEDRRVRLADWLTSGKSRFFAESTVNRVWYHLLGQGLVEPVDDFRDTNPASNPDLLRALADEFVRGGHRIKPVIRAILNSRTYQLSAQAPPQRSPQAAKPDRYFVRSGVRMLSAEQILDGISTATGVPEEFKGYPLGTRAIELAEGAAENHFLMAFAKPVRDVACDCARETDPTVNEVIHLLNNARVIERIKSPASQLGQWLAANKETAEIIELVYLASLSRRPTAAERKLSTDHVALNPDRRAGLEDLQHALFISNEFLLRH